MTKIKGALVLIFVRVPLRCALFGCLTTTTTRLFAQAPRSLYHLNHHLLQGILSCVVVKVPQSL